MCKSGIQGLSWVNGLACFLTVEYDSATRMNKHRTMTLLGIYLPVKQILQKGQVEKCDLDASGRDS